MPPQTVPSITAKNDNDSKMPLPRDRSCGASISGIAPYLAGTKNAECVPIKKTVDNTIHGPAGSPRSEPSPKPINANPAIATSANFQNTSDVRLLNRSERYPAKVPKTAQGLKNKMGINVIAVASLRVPLCNAKNMAEA